MLLLAFKTRGKPAAALTRQPVRLIGTIRQTSEHHNTEKHGWKTLDEEQPLPATQVTCAIQTQERTAQKSARNLRRWNRNHESSVRACSVGTRNPAAEIVNHPGEEPGLRHAEQKSDYIELGRGSDPRHDAREQAPGNCDSCDPTSSAYARQDDVTRHLENRIAQEEDAGTKSERASVESQCAVHLQGSHADVDPVQKAEEVEKEKKRQQSLADLRESADFDFLSFHAIPLESQRLTDFSRAAPAATPSERRLGAGLVYNTRSNKLRIDEEFSMKNFTSRQLRAFLLVAQYKSFSRAAGALFITPSGLSVLIRELETQLGVRLFDRTTRHVALTAPGAELLAIAQRNLHELDSAMSRIGGSASEPALSLSIGSPPLLMTSILAPAIKAFRSHRPELRFQLFDGATTITMQKVESGELDIGIGVFFEHLQGLRRTPLFRFPLAFIRAEKDPSFRPARTAWSALKGQPLVSLPRALAMQQFIDKHLARAGIVYEPVLVVNYVYTQIAMVEVGQGTAVIPSFGQLACRERRVTMSQLVNPVVHVDICQVRRAGRKLPGIAEEFTSFLQSHIAGWAGRSGML